MTPAPHAFDALARASRELHVACDRAGRVRYADARATRMLGVHAGDLLVEHVTPGCEDKLLEFLQRAAAHPVDGCEVPFFVHGRPVTVALCSVPEADGALVLGHVLPEAFAASVEAVSRMISEVTELNRQVAAQNAELRRVNAELSDSNRGVLALHDELKEQAAQNLQQHEIKSRLVANLSHELRTPLHSILGLCQLLASGRDGVLGAEQEKQVRFIRASADELLTLINDVLDLGRLDAGQAQLHIERGLLSDFVASLRGVLRPLACSPDVTLTVDDVAEDVELETDRSKLGQIVRNLVSNALKFTERGAVRVRHEVEGDLLRVMVSDTGIGIAAADQERIFEEYGQIDSALQRRLKGTGLGLPLARRMAERLGGHLTVESAPGVGSTFTVVVPLRHDEALAMQELLDRSRRKAPDATSVLVVEDDRRTLFLYEKYLVMAGFHVMPARTIDEATAQLREQRPAAIVLDIMLEGDASWSFLAQLKRDPATQDIPVLVVTVTNREAKARALGADEFWLKPVDQQRLLRKLHELARTSPLTRVLVIDDDDTARYIIRQHLDGSPYVVYEAANGDDGVRVARDQHPHVILLDFLLRGATAFDVIDELKADPRTRSIPIIVVTSQVLDAVDRERLLAEAEAVISKQHLSRELAINRIRDALAKAQHRAPARAR